MEEAQPKTRVLIVDDDQTLCDMYAERLKAEGYDVAVAHNGEEGAAKAVEYLPHVILLDLMMPKVNGFNTLEILKSTEETKNIPVLLLTALIQEENKRRGIQAGAEDYIIKSETMPGAVIEKIKAAVEKGKRMQQASAKVSNNSPEQNEGQSAIDQGQPSQSSPAPMPPSVPPASPEPDQVTPPPPPPPSESTPVPEPTSTPSSETMPPSTPPVTPESMAQQPPVASPPAEPSEPINGSQSVTPPVAPQTGESTPREELQTSFPPKSPEEPLTPPDSSSTPSSSPAPSTGAMPPVPPPPPQQ